MPVNGYRVGRDVTVTISGPGGTSIVIPASAKATIRTASASPSDQVTPAGDDIRRVTDKLGRKIGIRQLTVLQEMRLLKILGEFNSSYFNLCAQLRRSRKEHAGLRRRFLASYSASGTLRGHSFSTVGHFAEGGDVFSPGSAEMV